MSGLQRKIESEYLANFDRAVRGDGYAGTLKATWLLSDVHDLKWQLRTRKSLQINGNWQYTYQARWDRPLPNSNNFADSENSTFREALQKICFVARDNPNIPLRTNLDLRASISSILVLVSWLYLNDSRFKPAEFHFRRMTQTDLELYAETYARFGTYGLLQVPQRVLEVMMPGYDVSSQDPADYLLLPKNVRKDGRDYLIEHGLIDSGGKVDMQRFNANFGISFQEAKSVRHALFIRQFTSLAKIKLDDVHLPMALYTEYPSHRTPTVREVIHWRSSVNTNKTKVDDLKTLFSLRRFFPASFSSEDFDIPKVRSIAMKKGTTAGYTPLIPINDVLSIVDSAIAVILTWADSAISLYERCHEYFTENDLYRPVVNKQASYAKRNDWAIKQSRRLRSLPEPAGFSPHNYSARTASKVRTSPYLTELIQIVVGACSVIIAALKPLRRTELSELPFDCIRWKRRDGWWLLSQPAKAGVEDELPDTARPIPQIAARACKLLQRLNRVALGSSNTEDKKKQSAFLFFFPWLNGSATHATIWDVETIAAAIEKFSDFIQAPIDEAGRRYYLNIHELRKSFLLSFFWIFKFASLDAVRWIAGHNNVKHVFAYLETNVAAEEINELETDYAATQVRFFAKGDDLSAMENVEELYQSVLSHFGAVELDTVSEPELRAWIKTSLKTGRYQICPYNVSVSNGGGRTLIGFRINEAHGQA